MKKKKSYVNEQYRNVKIKNVTLQLFKSPFLENFDFTVNEFLFQADTG